MRPAKNNWPTTDVSKGILFVAQSMRELLAPDSFESFRAMALGTVTRIDETISLVEDVQLNRIPSQALEPVLQELQWSFNHDPAAKNLAAHEIEVFLEISNHKPVDVRGILHLLHFVRKRISAEYKAKVESLILELAANKNKRIELLQYCQLYCSHVINIGFSKSFIHDEVVRRFFTTDIRRTGAATLKSFFALFEEKNRKFEVHVVVPTTFGRFLSLLDFDLKDLSEAPNGLISAFPDLKPGRKDYRVLRHEVKAFDCYAAVHDTEDLLASVEALTTLAKRALKCDWRHPAYVAPLRAQNGRLVASKKIGLQQPIVETLSGGALKNITRNAKRIFEEFDSSSVERLLSSVNTFALAQKSSNIENRLISVWSAVEVLLSEPPINTVRILHYEKLLVPCICLKYVRRKFVAVYDELLVSYRRSLAALVSNVFEGESISQHTRFVFLMMLPEFENFRKELFNLLSENPLALNRVWRLAKDHASPKLAFDAVSAHEKRVKWQLHRIYRARNNLVHAGQVPTYIEGLYLNAVEYFRSSMLTIMDFARHEEEDSNVDQLVAEIGFEYDIYKKTLNKKTPDDMKFTKELILQIVRQ